MAITSLVSGYDDLFYDVILTDESTGLPLASNASGVVSIILCRLNTRTPLGPTATQILTSQGQGRWTGVHNDASVLAALVAGNVGIGQRFDIILQVGTLALRRLGSCQRVAVVDG